MQPADDRLSRIETNWSVIRRAHDPGAAAAQRAQQDLLERYGGAVRRYALAALRDEGAADDVMQEFALRFVRGDLRRANPAQGRFRSFVKTCVYHLVVDHQRRRQRDAWVRPLGAGALEPHAPDEPANLDALFRETWRDDLLSRVWGRLEQQESATGKPYYTALRCRVDHPDVRSPELAERLAELLGRPIKAGAARVLLHRARAAFAELMLDEVGHSLPDASPDALREELIELNLYEYCRPILKGRAAASGGGPA